MSYHCASRGAAGGLESISELSGWFNIAFWSVEPVKHGILSGAPLGFLSRYIPLGGVERGGHVGQRSEQLQGGRVFSRLCDAHDPLVESESFSRPAGGNKNESRMWFGDAVAL
eukprot:1185144-Prorocentrum_minimum.AAC.3